VYFLGDDRPPIRTGEIMGNRDKWEVERFGLLEESTILQGLKEGWLTLDDRVRQGEQDWGRIKVRLRPKFRFKAFIDPPAAYGERYSKYGAGVGTVLGVIIVLLLGSFPANIRGRVAVIGVVGIIGWMWGRWIGEMVGPRKAKRNPLPTTRQPVPDWMKGRPKEQPWTSVVFPTGLIDSLYFRFGYHFKCPKCGKRHRYTAAHCGCGYIPTDIKLSTLINLSRETGTQGTQVRVDDAKNIIRQCIEETGALDSYCAWKTFRDPTSERDYEQQWRLDFVKPDRFHVKQALWGETKVFDEWVTVGDQHYRNAGLWCQIDDRGLKERDSQLSQSFLVDDILTTLRTQEFVSSETYQHQNTEYLLLKYKNIESDDFILKGGEDLEMCIWIDLDTHLLAKGENYGKGQASEGDEWDVEVQHVFTAYNEQIEVHQPSGLQGTGSSKEKGMVYGVLPFHW